MMNGRYFGGRRVDARVYDGSLRLKSLAKCKNIGAENKERERMRRYEEWLEGEPKRDQESQESSGYETETETDEASDSDAESDRNEPAGKLLRATLENDDRQ